MSLRHHHAASKPSTRPGLQRTCHLHTARRTTPTAHYMLDVMRKKMPIAYIWLCFVFGRTKSAMPRDHHQPPPHSRRVVCVLPCCPCLCHPCLSNSDTHTPHTPPPHLVPHAQLSWVLPPPRRALSSNRHNGLASSFPSFQQKWETAGKTNKGRARPSSTYLPSHLYSTLVLAPSRRAVVGEGEGHRRRR